MTPMKISTKNDIMKQFLTEGAEYTTFYQTPRLPPVQDTPLEMVDFKTLNAKDYSGTYKGKTVNFYIADCDFLKIWNNPDDYLEKFRCCHSVIAPDFTIAVGQNGMPMALNIYNHYRNHALAFYWHDRGIKVIPNVNIVSSSYAPWIWDGLPTNSTLACSTIGRVKAKKSRLEFCEVFKQMCEYLKPTKVILVGHEIPELKADIPLLYYKSRSQTLNEKGSRGG